MLELNYNSFSLPVPFVGGVRTIVQKIPVLELCTLTSQRSPDQSALLARGWSYLKSLRLSFWLERTPLPVPCRMLPFELSEWTSPWLLQQLLQRCHAWPPQPETSDNPSSLIELVQRHSTRLTHVQCEVVSPAVRKMPLVFTIKATMIAQWAKASTPLATTAAQHAASLHCQQPYEYVNKLEPSGVTEPVRCEIAWPTCQLAQQLRTPCA